jgi:hypothetical protein
MSLKHFTVRLDDNFLSFWHAVAWVDSGKPCMLLNICIFFFNIFRRDSQRHRRSLVAVQNEIGVQKFLQTVQTKAPVKNREIGKNRYS